MTFIGNSVHTFYLKSKEGYLLMVRFQNDITSTIWFRLRKPHQARYSQALCVYPRPIATHAHMVSVWRIYIRCATALPFQTVVRFLFQIDIFQIQTAKSNFAALIGAQDGLFLRLLKVVLKICHIGINLNTFNIAKTFCID